jgi:large subunit ribosomal protein L25
MKYIEGTRVTWKDQVRGVPRKETMEKIVIEATRREVTGKKVRFLRREGKLPAVLFGYGVDSTPITLDLKEASRTLSHVGSSTLVTIALDGKEYNTLVRERQQDVIYRTLTHVDFQAVSMTETVRAQVSIHIVGDHDIAAVENYGAIINTGLDVLEIECLPQDLPERIEVELTGLSEIGDSILVKDLTLPQGVVALDDPEALVVVVSAPISEEEPEEEEILEEGAEPEVIEKGYGEEED